MKMFRFWVLLVLVVWTIFNFHALSTSLTTSSNIYGMTVPICVDSMEAKSSIKELELKNSDLSTKKKVKSEGNLNLEDYHQIDPAPDSRATIKYGPIEHGTPTMPYIPKPAPPYDPNRGVSPSPS